MQIKPETGQGKPEPKKPIEKKPTPTVKPAAAIDKKKIILIAAAVVVGILVIGLVAYFVFRAPAPVFGPPLITIENLLLASTVDEDFNYVERENSTYTKGEIVIIYHEINMEPIMIEGEYKIIFGEFHELFDPNNQKVSGISGANSLSVNKIVASSELYRIPFKSEINTLNLTELGTYTYRITIIDEFTSEDITTEEIKFILKE